MEHASEGCTCEGKFCKECQQTKCLGYIAWNKLNNKIYYRHCCKACNNQRNCAWRNANPEKFRRSLRISREKRINANPCKEKERLQKYRQNRIKNAKSWNEANPKKLRAHRAAWGKANPEKLAEHARTRRARRLQSEGNFTSKEWKQLKEQYNHTCLCCGRKEPDIQLTADHVVPLKKRGDNHISNIQPLCRSCNSKKYIKSTDYRPLYKK